MVCQTYAQRYGLAMWRNSVIRLTVTEAKLVIKCSLFILLPGVFRLLELKPNSEKKAVRGPFPRPAPTPRHAAAPGSALG